MNRRGRRWGRLAACLLVPGLLMAASPTRQQVQEAERARAAQIEAQRAALARAAALSAEESRLGAERVATAARLRALESASAEAADRVADLARRRDAAQTRLAERAAALGPFLPVIERLALYPAETLLAVPMPPEQAVRGVLVLGGLTRQLEADAAALRTEQADLAALSAELDQAVPELARRQAAQAAQAAALDAQIATAQQERHVAEDRAADSARRAAAEAARATGLRAAIARLEAEQEAAEARRVAEAKAAARRVQEAASRPASPPDLAPAPTGPMANLVIPVAGTVLRGFGDAVDGGTSSGLTYQVPPSARVVAPCGGRVVFAGPFRSFGLLTIISCGGGWHAVMSGFERLDAGVGQAVQAGEPVGVMPAFDLQSAARRPTLMLELRHDGQAVNPAPYLRGRG
jgi:septal ring factor EnvC (AmiA/AmiB activator)